jgi:RHS repeat-associated protein
MRLPDGSLNYLHTDHLGSTVAATNALGAVVGNNQPRYDAFGNERVGSVYSLPTDFAFTGQKRDKSGLMYFGARYFDPALGTFISADSIVVRPGDPASLNRYTYSRNNPMRYRDPSGHDWEDVRYNLEEFVGGFLAEWAYVNTAQTAKALAVQPNESVPATAGRVAADAFGIYQDAEFMVGGLGLMAGGVAASPTCMTGVGCLVAGAAVVGGAALTADGAMVASYAAVNGGTNLSNLVMKASAGESSAPGQDGDQTPRRMQRASDARCRSAKP